MEIKVLGICGSPVKGGNSEVFLREALRAIEGVQGVSTELIALSGKEIGDCLHCNWCLRKQEEGRFCNQQDDMTDVFPKVLEADAMLLATPVYFGRLSGYIACFIDRLRVFTHGNYYGGKLRNKVGGALAVGWARNSGMETTILTLLSALFILGMLPVVPRGALGAIGLSSEGGAGKFNPKERLGVLKDEYGLAQSRGLSERAVEMARLVKAGNEALKAGLFK